MADGTGPVIVGPGEGAKIEGPVGGPLTFKARAEQTNGIMTALENVIPPGQGPPLHTHSNEDESWYVLEGKLRFKLDSEIRQAPAGRFVFVPRGTPHCFQNVGTDPARILVMFTPAGMERFFDQFATLTAPDPSAFARIGEPLGMNVIGPPLGHSDPCRVRAEPADLRRSSLARGHPGVASPELHLTFSDLYAAVGPIRPGKGDLMRTKYLVLAATASLAAMCLGLSTANAHLPSLPPGSDFARRINNPWLPFLPGTAFTYNGVKDGRQAVDVLTVTHTTQLISGIRATVIQDRLYEWTGHRPQRHRYLAERTTDWYAQDKHGNVWYLGENTATLAPNGHVISTEGTWRVGVNGAQAGIFMPAHPNIGTTGYQEFYPGHAEDRYRVLRLNAHVSTPAASSRHALLTKETTALEPGVVDHKYYIRGIGDVIERTVRGGNEHFTLVSVQHP